MDIGGINNSFSFLRSGSEYSVQNTELIRDKDIFINEYKNIVRRPLTQRMQRAYAGNSGKIYDETQNDYTLDQKVSSYHTGVNSFKEMGEYNTNSIDETIPNSYREVTMLNEGNTFSENITLNSNYNRQYSDHINEYRKQAGFGNSEKLGVFHIEQYISELV